MATGIHDGHKRLELPLEFAHSLIPIIVGLRHRPLPELPRRGRPADADPPQRPVQHRRELPRHRQPGAELLAVLPPDVPGGHQGAAAVIVGHVLAVIAAHDRAVKLLPEAAPAHRPAAAAGGDGRLHDRRALPAVRRLSRPRRPAVGALAGRRVSTSVGQPAASAASRPPSSRVRPATSARSTAARSSGRKCSPASGGEPRHHPGDVAPPTSRGTARIRLTTTRTGRALGVLAQLDEAARQPGQARPGRRRRRRPPRRPRRSPPGSSRCGPAGRRTPRRCPARGRSRCRRPRRPAPARAARRCSTVPVADLDPAVGPGQAGDHA